MPTNKIGELGPGEGLRRIEAQKEGGWHAGDQGARDNYEIGAELEPPRPGGTRGEKNSPNRPHRKGRYNG